MQQKTSKIIRVLIAEDSPFIAKVIASLISSDPQMQVVGMAHNGKEAVEMAMTLKPDIITMDIHMPVMDGYEATKQIMAHCPVPILIASAAVQADGVERMFRAVSYGALDLLDISELTIGENSVFGDKFLESIRLLSRIKVVHHLLAKLEGKHEQVPPVAPIAQEHGTDSLLAIVASTGGPQAIYTVLKALPLNFPCGIVIVQHITSGFLEQFAQWLHNECKLTIKIAEQGEVIKSGTVYLAPCDLQMRVVRGGILHLTDEPIYDGHKPSGTVLLDSVAQVYREKAVAVILTGMGKDGAKGMVAIRAAGGKTIAQDKDSSIVFGMPKEAIDLGCIDRVCPVEEIAPQIVEIFNRGARRL